MSWQQEIDKFDKQIKNENNKYSYRKIGYSNILNEFDIEGLNKFHNGRKRNRLDKKQRLYFISENCLNWIKENSNKYFCKCGCETDIFSQKITRHMVYHWRSKGIPNYLAKHHQDKHKKIIRYCEVCKKEFYIFQSDLKIGYIGKFCSRLCYTKCRNKPKVKSS